MNAIFRIALSLLFLVKQTNCLQLGYHNSINNILENQKNSNTIKLSTELTKDADESRSSRVPAFDDSLKIKFYGPVSDQSCLELSQVLNYMDIKAKQMKVAHEDYEPKIHLHIQSGGGSLMPSFYICDLIKSIKTPVYTYVDGYCASAASLISVCGDKRFMTKHSSILIHQLSSAAAGKYNELKTEVDNLSVFMKSVKNIYLENTNIDPELLEQLLSTDIWLDSETCSAYGLVDDIIH